MVCIVLIYLAEQFPNISIPYWMLEYMNAWYIILANLYVTLHFILFKIPKYINSAKPKYWNYLAFSIVISLVTISSHCFSIGFYITWNIMKLVMSHVIVNLFLTHHKYSSSNFDTTIDIRLYKFSPYITAPCGLQIARYNLAPLQWFSNDFLEWRSQEWKSLPKRPTSD